MREQENIRQELEEVKRYMREREEKWLSEKEEMEKRITELERMVVKGGERRERRGWRKKNIERKLKEV